MVLDSWMLFGIEGVSNAALFILGAVAFRYAMLAIPQSRSRWRSSELRKSFAGRSVPITVRRVLFLGRQERKLGELQLLLVGSGIAIDPIVFETIRRIGIGLVLLLGILGYAAFKTPVLVLYIEPVYVIVASLILFIPLLGYRIVLQSVKQRRSHRIVKEIYVLSNQLLYYSNSRMNLHSKLHRCIPFTRTVRSALQTLLNEWYQDADLALKHFKMRLGTDEAYGFAETLNSLRLGERDNYYELLRERIDDYKQKIDLDKESRKETVSYLLFVLAGLPILNTFRLFLYPWVMEGQRLFQTLN